MANWENWDLSSETKNRLNKIFAEYSSTNSEVSSMWISLYYNESPTFYNSFEEKMEVTCNESDSREEDVIILIKESIKANTALPDSTLIGLSFNSISRILLTIKETLTETEFSGFCKLIATWSNESLIEEALKIVILPKLMEKSEASSCTIFSIKELAVSLPNKLCENVLIPLMNDEKFQFTDFELLNEVLSVLQPAQRDLLVMNLTSKENLQENDWSLLQSLVTSLSSSSTTLILNCIYKFSNKFTKSQVFGRFLVNFCKNLEITFVNDELFEAINNHQTLLKYQALKYLNSL